MDPEVAKAGYLGDLAKAHAWAEAASRAEERGDQDQALTAAAIAGAWAAIALAERPNP